LLVAFLLGLPLMLSKLHALVIGEIISNAWSNVWFGATLSLLSIKIRVWHLGLSSGYVFGIELGWSSKFTTWGCGKWKRWSMPPIAHVIFGVLPKMLWNFSYHDQEEGGALVALHASCSSQYFYFILMILFQHCFQVCDTSLGNATLILFASSSQSFSSHKLIIIMSFPLVHNLLLVWDLTSSLGALKPTFTFRPNPKPKG
jgi:hypothetical protein